MGEKESGTAGQAGSRLEGAAGGGIAIDEEGVQRAAPEALGSQAAQKAQHDTAKNTIQNMR